jgi:uncharacterized protein
MRMLIASLLVASVLVSAPARAQQPTDPAKVADIKKLLQLTGAGDIGKQVMDQMLAQFRRTLGDKVPAKFWDDLSKEVNPNEFVTMVVPVYEQNLSHEDIRALIKFYSSPSGRRFVAALPKITSDSMKLGQTWGQELTQRVMKKLQAAEADAKKATPSSKPETK